VIVTVDVVLAPCATEADGTDSANAPTTEDVTVSENEADASLTPLPDPCTDSEYVPAETVGATVIVIAPDVADPETDDAVPLTPEGALCNERSTAPEYPPPRVTTTVVETELPWVTVADDVLNDRAMVGVGGVVGVVDGSLPPSVPPPQA
jgi:hypothetical protein